MIPEWLEAINVDLNYTMKPTLENNGQISEYLDP